MLIYFQLFLVCILLHFILVGLNVSANMKNYVAQKKWWSMELYLKVFYITQMAENIYFGALAHWMSEWLRNSE